MMQQMLLGMGGVVESEKLRVLRLDGSEHNIGENSTYVFQDGDIIEPILADYTVTIKCAGKRGLRNADYNYVNPGRGYGAWVQGTINMRYGTKYYVRINDGIGALYWGDSGVDNVFCMMLGAEGGYGKRYAAGFYEDWRDWANDLNALGLGGNAGVCNSSGYSTGSSGQGSPGIDMAYGSPVSVDSGGGGGGSVTGHGSSGGSGGSGGTASGPSGANPGGAGGYFTRGTVNWSGTNVSGGGEGGMGYFGGGGGGSVLYDSSFGNMWAGGGGGGGASYAGGVPSSYLLNSSIDDASVTNITSELNNDAATADIAFVRMESAPIVEAKEEPYWGGYEYGGAVATWGGSPFELRDNAGLKYGFYTRTGTPAVDSGDFGGNNGIREREIVWDGELVHNTGNGSGTNVGATAPNANGWIVADDYAYSWVDIITKMFPNSSGDAIQGITSSGQNGPPGSYYPWDGDQCNCFNVMRVEARYAELYTADEIRPIVIAARLPRIIGTSPDDIYPEYFSSSDPV